MANRAYVLLDDQLRVVNEIMIDDAVPWMPPLGHTVRLRVAPVETPLPAPAEPEKLA